MPLFKIGDRVCLKRTASDFVEIGTVTDVIPSDSGLFDFALFDVDFGSGVLTFHGFELRPVPSTVSFCADKQNLLVAYNKAIDIYVQLTSELVDAVGMMAHVEFEFLKRNAEAAKRLLVKAREQLDEHTAKHGC